jgi:hypothetical protein
MRPIRSLAPIATRTGGGTGLDHFVGFFRAQIKAAAVFAARAHDREVVLVGGRFSQDLTDRIARTHLDARRRNLVAAQQFGLRCKRRPQGWFVGCILHDPEEGGFPTARARDQPAEPRRVVRGIGSVAANEETHLGRSKVCGR